MRKVDVIVMLALLGCGREPVDGSDSSALDTALTGESDLVAQGDWWACVPRDLTKEDWYGCWVQTDTDDADDKMHCVTPSERLRLEADGAVVIQMQPMCAGDRWWDVRVDGNVAPSNLIVWQGELRLPPGSAGSRLDPATEPGVEAAWRFRDDVLLDEDACGHETLVHTNHEGDEFSLCRQEWREFRARAGEVPGFVGGTIDVVALDTEIGDAVTIEAGFAACGEGSAFFQSYPTGGQTVAANCCIPVWPQRLDWRVAAGGVLTSENETRSGWYSSMCCEGIDNEVLECADYTLDQWERGPEEP